MCKCIIEYNGKNYEVLDLNKDTGYEALKNISIKNEDGRSEELVKLVSIGKNNVKIKVPSKLKSKCKFIENGSEKSIMSYNKHKKTYTYRDIELKELGIIHESKDHIARLHTYKEVLEIGKYNVQLIFSEVVLKEGLEHYSREAINLIKEAIKEFDTSVTINIKKL